MCSIFFFFFHSIEKISAGFRAIFTSRVPRSLGLADCSGRAGVYMGCVKYGIVGKMSFFIDHIFNAERGGIAEKDISQRSERGSYFLDDSDQLTYRMPWTKSNMPDPTVYDPIRGTFHSSNTSRNNSDALKKKH